MNSVSNVSLRAGCLAHLKKLPSAHQPVLQTSNPMPAPG
eukprot:CAMPEP_0172714842 /NCGR_PEP_ID=MMETSP1074-20121228/67002_1 /TAXON_ID=2916 /ORGANISM="Ceratium fusus, Strain PA161109" /LENGTH=38 /DNA_ID= /DNA_START= /DNA_END= /DNA_ORIENTATION=